MAGTVLGRSGADINAYLKRMKQVKIANGQLDAEGKPIETIWQDQVPAAMSYQRPAETGLLTGISNEIASRDAQVTGTAITESQNAKNNALYLQQKALLRQAKKSYQDKLTKQEIRQAANAAGTPTLQGGTLPGIGSGSKAAPSIGNNGIQSVGPGALTTIVSHGHSVTVSSTVAGRFKGFLDALWAKGYHFKSVGGYANRNIAGTSTPSLHSLGMAIDVDPTSNPTAQISKSGKYVYALPPSVGALAAKYGLAWGGNWHSYKDFMHFSVPYGGRE